MSNERDRARLISEYADDLIARRKTDRRETESAPEADFSRMLDITRTLSEIEFEMPPGLKEEVLGDLGTERVRPRVERAGWLLRRAAVVATIAVAIAVTTFIARREPVVSAAELLTASTKAERARIERPGLIAHRAYTLAAHRSTDRTPMLTQHIEVWVDANAGVKARRVFDANRRLIGGEWTNRDGSRVLYEPGQRPRREAASDDKPLTLESIWRWDPSSTDFLLMVGVQADRVTARVTAEGFELAANDAGAGLAQVELTLDKEHLPVGQHVVLRDDDGAIDVLTRRTTWEEVPVSQVASATFEPEAELLPAIVSTVAPAPPPESEIRAAPVPLGLTPQAIDGLELQAWYRLHQLAHCLADAGELYRGSEGVRLRITLATEACRAEATTQFATLAATPGVSIDLAVGAASPSAQTDAAATAGEALGSDQALAAMPTYRVLYDFHSRQALRDPQSGRDVDTVVNPLIRQTALWARESSSRRLAVVRELQRLSDRWSFETLKPLGLDAASMWQSMVRDNARTLVEQTESLVLRLEPALGIDSTPGGSRPSGRGVRTLDEARRAIGELQGVVVSNNADVRQLFTPVKPEGQSRAVPDAARAVDALRQIVQLARRLTEPWSLDQ